MSEPKTTNRAEKAAEVVAEKAGLPGLRALAMFMHWMGSDARLVWGDERGEEAWVACDTVMCHAWELGGDP